MKKLFIAIALFTGFSVVANAQTPAPVKTVTAKKTSVAATTKTTQPAVVSTPAKSVTAHPLKADGTADKRFKANRQATVAKPAGPLKKDGTADMRYKTNKMKKQ